MRFLGTILKTLSQKPLDKMVLKLSDLGLEGETKDLKNLYESVKTEAARAKSPKSQQELIKNLYNTFFKEAFRKQSEKLGIVYRQKFHRQSGENHKRCAHSANTHGE